MISDEEIIKGCIDGNKKFQRLLYEKYASRMLGVCIRYFRDIEEAEDALQEGFIKVFNNISKFRFEGSFEGWIRRIMINTALNYYRSNLKHYFHSDVDESEDKVVLDYEFNDVFYVEDLLKIVKELPTGYQMIFNLFEIEGYSHKEIAKQLKISKNTSKSQLLKARKLLQKKLALLKKHENIEKNNEI